MIKKANSIVIIVLMTLSLLFTFGTITKHSVAVAPDEGVQFTQNVSKLYSSIGFSFAEQDELLEDQTDEEEDMLDVEYNEFGGDVDEFEEVISGMNWYRNYFIDEDSDHEVVYFNGSTIDEYHILFNLAVIFSVQVLLLITITRAIINLQKDKFYYKVTKSLRITLLLSLILVVTMFNVFPAGEMKIAGAFKFSIILQFIALLYLSTVSRYFEGDLKVINIKNVLLKTSLVTISFLIIVSLSYSFINISYRNDGVQNIDIKDHLQVLDFYDYKHINFETMYFKDVEEDDVVSSESIYVVEHSDGLSQNYTFSQFALLEDDDFNDAVKSTYVFAGANTFFILIGFFAFSSVLNYATYNDIDENKTKKKEKLAKFYMIVMVIPFAFLMQAMVAAINNLPNQVNWSRLNFEIPGNMIFLSILVILGAVLSFVNFKSIDKFISLEVRDRPKKEKVVKQKNQPVSHKETVNPNKGDYAQLKLLKELLDMGAITEDEYNEKKREIL